MSKVVIMNKEDLLYVSKGKWDGNFDGSMLQMTVDENLPRFVRVGVRHEEVVFFNKKDFVKHLKSFKLDLEKVAKAEAEWSNSDFQDEYEHFVEACEPLILSYDYVEMTYYINAFDFIRDIAALEIK